MTAPVSFQDAITLARQEMVRLYESGQHGPARGAEAVWRALLRARPQESSVVPLRRVK